MVYKKHKARILCHRTMDQVQFRWWDWAFIFILHSHFRCQIWGDEADGRLSLLMMMGYLCCRMFYYTIGGGWTWWRKCVNAHISRKIYGIFFYVFKHTFHNKYIKFFLIGDFIVNTQPIGSVWPRFGQISWIIFK